MIPNTARSIVAVVALLAAGRPAEGQTPGAPSDPLGMNLDQLVNVEVDRVQGASRYLQSVSRAPASVTIVKAREIEEFGYRTLADVLRSVRGLYTSYDRSYEFIGVRGFSRPGDYNSRVLVLVDGHRVNNALYDMALIGTDFPVDLAVIDRIEIIRGPGSTMYGTSAFLAVVNILTKAPGEMRRVEASVAAGNLGTQMGRLGLSHQFASGLGLVLSGSLYTSAQQSRLYFPEFDTPETNDGYAEDLDNDAAQSIYASASYGGWSWRGAWSHRQKDVPTAYFGTAFNDPQNLVDDVRAWADASYGRAMGHDGQLLARAYVDSSSYQGDYPYLFDTGRDVEKDVGYARWLGGEGTFRFPVGSRHTVVAGAEWRYHWRLDQAAAWETSGDALLDVRKTSTNWAVYVQDDVALSKALSLTVGVRRDGQTGVSGATSARAGLVVSPSPDTAVKFLYGGAFRAPNVYELYYHAGPDRPLEPERIGTGEIVLEQQFGRQLRLSALAFRNRIRQILEQQPVGDDDVLGVYYENSGSAEADGVELEADMRVGERVDVRVSHTSQWVGQSRNTGRLSNAPRHLSYVAARWVIAPNRLIATYEGQYVGERLTRSGGSLPGRYLQNVTATWKLPGGHAALQAGIRNLGKVAYAEPGAEEHLQESLQQNGRTYWAGLRLGL